MGRSSYVCLSMRGASVGVLSVTWVPTSGCPTIPVVTASNMHSNGCVGSSYGMVTSGASQRTMDEGPFKCWMRASRLLGGCKD